MSKHYTADCLRFDRQLRAELPDVPAQDVAALVDLLLKSATILTTCNTNECNVGLTPRQECRKTITEAAVRAACAKFGIGVELDGDPRGLSIGLRLPSGATTGWGGLYCVPEEE